jgi:hypothetical protein
MSWREWLSGTELEDVLGDLGLLPERQDEPEQEERPREPTPLELLDAELARRRRRAL